ncbi:domain-containing CRADD [Octopus vulgaris]|uniref:Domain-containing CRADD n=2 Tax=Octopus TaxID=6643 RepID=A0AA36BGT8_OCTVU|nr:uncharacterized protein LOC118766026 [Octopus sinensis]CAI9733331.1 domain-containing CRADD [Octopus vulgaris]
MFVTNINSREITLSSGKEMADTQEVFNGNKIQRSYKQLVDGIDEVVIGSILDYFFASSIFIPEEVHTVEAEPIIERKNRCFLNFLLEKMKHEDRSNISRIFDEFLKCLRESELDSLATLVEETDNSPLVDLEVDAIIDSTKDLDLDEKMLARVLMHVASGWEAVIIELGLDFVKITDAKETDNEFIQKFKVFNTWRQADGLLPGAVVKLLTALREFPEIVNWSKMKNTIAIVHREMEAGSSTSPS